MLTIFFSYLTLFLVFVLALNSTESPFIIRMIHPEVLLASKINVLKHLLFIINMTVHLFC